MFFYKSFIFLFSWAVVNIVYANTPVPSCVGSDQSKWNGCIGTQVFYGYATYYGEFTNGEITGYGMHVYTNGDKYIGYHRGGRFNGRGTYIFADGRPKREGVWVEGLFSEVSNSGVIKNRPPPQLVNQSTSPPSTSPEMKKCLRLGLIAGSDDFKLCMQSR